MHWPNNIFAAHFLYAVYFFASVFALLNNGLNVQECDATGASCMYRCRAHHSLTIPFNVTDVLMCTKFR